MQELVTNIIIRDCFKILPEAEKLQGVSIKADRRFGLHVVTSPRFICTMKVTGVKEEPFGIKVFVKNRPNVDEEIKNMRLLWSTHYGRNHKYHIPEPLYIDDEHALLFMRYWPGETLLPLLYKSAARGRRRRDALLENYVRDAAGWLVDFQEIYSSADDKEIPSEMLAFEAQVTTAPSLKAATRRRIIDKMRGLEKGLPSLRDTYVHDQYLFRNILYKDGEVCVVDFPHFRTGWPLYDFFTFYTGIERLKQYPFISDMTCDWMQNIFADAYFSQKKVRYEPQLVDNLWMFFITAYIGKRYRYKQFMGIRGTMNNMFVQRMFRRLAKWGEQ